MWVEDKFQGMRDIINKHKKYTREEVNKLIIEGIKDFCEMNPLLRGCQVTDLEIEEWRKENL